MKCLIISSNDLKQKEYIYIYNYIYTHTMLHIVWEKS